MAHQIELVLRTATVSLLLTLAGCDRPPSEVPAPSPPENPAPDSTPVPAPATSTPPSETPSDPAQPEATPPSPVDPSAVPQPTATEPNATEPPLESMRVAQAGAKISVAVDLRYQFEAAPLPNQPVLLHLAAVPRVGGDNLRVSVKPAEGLQLAAAAGPLQVQKATPSGVYRQQMSVTRAASGPESLRVLVTMDMPEGRAFGYYSIPMTGDTTAQKLDSVKQR